MDKLGYFTTTNQKGQVVIPKKIREKLNIKVNSPINLVIRGNGIYLYPIKNFAIQSETENSYLSILSKTKGAWQDEIVTEIDSRGLELSASSKRKLAWW